MLHQQQYSSWGFTHQSSIDNLLQTDSTEEGSVHHDTQQEDSPLPAHQGDGPSHDRTRSRSSWEEGKAERWCHPTRRVGWPGSPCDADALKGCSPAKNATTASGVGFLILRNHHLERWWRFACMGGVIRECLLPSKRSSRSSAEALKWVRGTSCAQKGFQDGRIASVSFLLVGGRVSLLRTDAAAQFSVSDRCGKLEGVPPLMMGVPDNSIFITISFWEGNYPPPLLLSSIFLSHQEEDCSMGRERYPRRLPPETLL